MLAQGESERLRKDALANIDNGKFGEAIELLNRYISSNPQNPEGFNLRGVCFEKRGEYEKAVYDFRSALKLDSKNPVYQSNLARTAVEFHKILYNIIAGYKREIAINPKLAKNYLEVGKNYKKLGEWLEAEKWYDEYHKREEASSDELLRYSEILVKTGHLKKGEPYLKDYTDKYPDDHRLWSRYGYFSMWLGKKQTALKSFEKALELRPYFKEAMDGYDLVRGKGYVYTVNDTTTQYNYGIPLNKKGKRYAIDRYYSKLKKSPEDIETRYLLIAELVKKNRFEEAGIQLEILSDTELFSKKFLVTKEDVDNKKNEYYSEMSLSLEKKLQKNPNNREVLLKLVNYYSLYGDNIKAINKINKYLESNKADEQIRYQKARLYSQLGELNSARDEMEILITDFPNNNDYRLFYGQLLVWMNTDLPKADKNLKLLLSEKPENLDALIAETMLNLQLNNLSQARIYLEKGLELDPVNKELLNLKTSISLQEKNNKKADAFELLEIARGYSLRKNCDAAVEEYHKYFEHPYADNYLRKELAEAYLCSDDYDKAIEIYEKLVAEYPADYDLMKQLAKVYFWSGDSLSALQEFEKLTALNSDDAEVKILLGDTYMKIGDYENARKIYEEMLEISPSSHILQTRIAWLGNEGYYGFSSTSFPAYFSILPSATFFSDDLDFSYNTQGAKLELGITGYLAVSIGAYLGSLSSADTRLNINIIRADGILKFNKYVKGMVGAGITKYDNDQNSNIFDAAIIAEREDKYKFSASFYAADAAQILYSPFLVDQRLNANFARLTAEFTSNDLIIFGADFSYISVSDNNKGNKLYLRLGKSFDNVFKTGYEYFLLDFKEQKTDYWSPRKFETHSAWMEWNVFAENELHLNIKGKVGFVPVDNFVVKEVQGIIHYYFTRSFVLQTNVSFSNSVSLAARYNALSFGIAIFWTL